MRSASLRLPYPGLRAFHTDETDLFFGRETCTDQMVDRLAKTHFLAVLGPSGSGKSSLVKTGLLDALALGLLAKAGSRWQVVEMRPAGDPLPNLAAAMLKSQPGPPAAAETVARLTEFLRRTPRAVIEWCLGGNVRPHASLLILADQFEELFRYTDYSGQQEAEAFVALLIESARNRTVPIYVVITMRSEFLGPCALIPDLAEMINEGLYLTRRMTRDETRAAITGPAGVCDFEIEPALVNRLLNDLVSFAPWETEQTIDRLQVLARRADQLPLMQHALNRLWMQADQSLTPVTLHAADYVALGGLSQALSDHADEVLARLTVDADVPEIIFKALVSGTSVAAALRRPCQLGTLAALCGGRGEQVAAVVAAFSGPDCNFLMVSPDGPLTDASSVDISHESLIRQWQKLTAWMLQDASAAERYRVYEAQAMAWRAGGRGVLRGTELQTALAWQAAARPGAVWARRYSAWPESDAGYHVTIDYLTRSETHWRDTKNAKRISVYAAAVLAAAVLIITGVSGFETYAATRGDTYYYGHNAAKNYARALGWYQRASLTGNIEAELDAAEIYRDGGHGVPQNYALARQWYQRAAAQGNAEAMRQIGILYDTNNNPECKRAIDWYERASSAGNIDSNYDLGLHYEKGWCVKQDYQRARQYFLIAAKNGALRQENAEDELGKFYLYGWGVPKAYSQAFNYFSAAAKAGIPESEKYLGLMYENGDYVGQDYAEAMALYEQAAKGGDAEAATDTGYMYGIGEGVPQDYTQAFYWFQLGATGGYHVGMEDLGIYFQQGLGVKPDYKKAKDWFMKAYADGDANAPESIAEIYDYGEGVPADPKKAFSWHLKAAAGGSGIAAVNVGVDYDLGTGVAQNYAQAMKYYLIAVARGNVSAEKYIGELYQAGQGTKQDYAMAAHWYEQAGNDGSADADYKLGLLYDDEGKDSMANNWFWTAANAGSPEAQDKEGLIALQMGTPDYDAAMKWFKKASNGGNSDANIQMALLYLKGLVVSQNNAQENNAQALSWMAKSAGDNQSAAKQIALLYLKGQAIPQNDAQALSWMEKSTSDDQTDAESAIGDEYRNGTDVSPSGKQALKWYLMAAHDGSADAAEKIGNMYLNGDAISQSRSTALQWYRRAAVIAQQVVAKNPANFNDIGSLSYYEWLSGQPRAAIQMADKGFAMKPDQIWILTNKADALMLSGQTKAAKSLYLKYKTIPNDGTGATWQSDVRGDFITIKKLYGTFPLMNEIMRDFNS